MLYLRKLPVPIITMKNTELERRTLKLSQNNVIDLKVNKTSKLSLQLLFNKLRL
jgi:hypothetical protein